MRAPLALAAASTALRNLVEGGLAQVNLAGVIDGGITVSALAPDLIDTASLDAPPRLNLFLFHAAFDAGQRIANAPVDIDMRYLVTAYARDEAVTEMLLGRAMFVLHETPILTPDALRGLLDPARLPPALQPFAASGLADEIEEMRITPQPMSFDDAASVWSAIRCTYRPTLAYRVTLTLGQTTAAPSRTA